MSSTDGVNVREAGLDDKRNKPRHKNKKSVRRCVGEVLKDWVAKIFKMEPSYTIERISIKIF